MSHSVAEPRPAAAEPECVDLSIAEAASILHTSENDVHRLIDSGMLPAFGSGGERRVRRDLLLAYKRQDDERRGHILDELTAEAQELGLGY